MYRSIPIMTVTRGTALVLALSLPLAGTAYADEYDSARSHEALIRQAAASQPAPALAQEQVAKLSDDFKVGAANASGAERSSQLAPVPLSTPARLASLSQTIAGQPDVVGAGGAQDELARAIYHPGSGTDW